jgi:hypothetical protein
MRGVICLLLPPRTVEGATAWGLHPIGAEVVEPGVEVKLIPMNGGQLVQSRPSVAVTSAPIPCTSSGVAAVCYLALGGTADFAGMVVHLGGSADVLDAHQRDVAAHALNECLADLGHTEICGTQPTNDGQGWDQDVRRAETSREGMGRR